MWLLVYFSFCALGGFDVLIADISLQEVKLDEETVLVERLCLM